MTLFSTFQLYTQHFDFIIKMGRKEIVKFLCLALYWQHDFILIISTWHFILNLLILYLEVLQLNKNSSHYYYFFVSLCLAFIIFCTVPLQVLFVTVLACRWRRWDFFFHILDPSGRFGTGPCVLWQIAIYYYCTVLRINDCFDSVWLQWSQKCLVGPEITWHPASTRHGHFVLCAVRRSGPLLKITRCQKQTFVLWWQAEPPLRQFPVNWTSEIVLFVCAFKFSDISVTC